MHSLSMALIAVMAVITLPALTFALDYSNGTEGSEIEEPKILPLTAALKSDDERQLKNVNEIWQEDVHEVVIRKQRGAKENGAGTTTGKKKERKEKNTSSTTKVPKLDRNSDTNLETNNNTSTTQEPIGKKHQHHQSNKHEKTNSKKHSSTIKPKTKDENSCRYTKGAWSECDAKANTRSRTLTLKKGEGSCVQTRTIQKKCKKGKNEKACRYDKGTFAECQPSGEMTRIDKLKATSDSTTCPATRTINKKCNKTKQDKQARNSKEKKQKDRKNRQ